MMTILSILLFYDNDAISGSDGGFDKGTVIVIAIGIAHGDGDGNDGIDRKVNRKINDTTYKFFNSGFPKERMKK